MIVTPRFIFLHLHKSGGTFVNDGLLRHEPGARQFGYHLPRHCVPSTHARVPVLGLVRNPFSFYQSWYAFQAARDRPNALFRIVSHEGCAGFAATIRRLLSLGEDDALLERVVAALPTAYTNHGLNLPGPALAAIRGTGLGFYSFLFQYLYRDADSVHIARMERLRTELPAVMARAGVPANDGLTAYLRDAVPLNASGRAEPHPAYDDSLCALVATHDGELIRRYGYASDPPARSVSTRALRAAPTYDEPSAARR